MPEIKILDLGDVQLAYKEIGSGDKYLISTQNFFLTDCHMELLGKPLGMFERDGDEVQGGVTIVDDV